jgi:hypothetical protein
MVYQIYEQVQLFNDAVVFYFAVTIIRHITWCKTKDGMD